MGDLVKILGDLRRMRGNVTRDGGNAPPEEPPPDINALRAELMRRLDRIREKRAAGLTARDSLPEGKG